LRDESRAAAVLPKQFAARARRRAATEGRLLPSRDDRAGEEDGAVLQKDEDVRFFTAYNGRRPAALLLSLDPELPNPGYAVVHRHDQGT
jgi:hypothetical protein